MLRDIRDLLRSDKKLQLMLLVMALVQIIIAVTQLGFYQDDQHFQIIEFSSYQLKNPSAATGIWEFTSAIRPTLQVYLFSGYYEICQFLTIRDPFLQLTILRVITALLLFGFFNVFTLYYFKNAERKVLYYVLLIGNLSWALPYTRTLFNSEMMASLLFFGALLFYQVKKNNHTIFSLVLTGFLFSLSFYFRFQMGFALAGFGLWMLFFEKDYNRILPMVCGFILGAALNSFLDYQFYHKLVFTPYSYFHSNISEGKAATFGTSSFLRYVFLIIGVAPIPPLSLFLLYYAAKAWLKKYSHPLFISVVFFIVGHCFVGHKEERFLFPIFNVLPVLLGWGLPAFISYYQHAKKWIRQFIRAVCIFSIVLNVGFLSWQMFIPYAQTVNFSRLLKKEFPKDSVTIFCISRLPSQRSRNFLVFYSKASENIGLKKLADINELPKIKGSPVFFASTFNQIKDQRAFLDSLGFKPVLYSSRFLWELNRFLLTKKIHTINDAWVLYKKE
jgi:phosphatidylinositol glycan class B